MAENPFWTYWYFHVPNYLLAAVLYTLLGRFLLGLFVPPDWNNYIWRFFCRVTHPVLAAVAWVTPVFVHSAFLPLVERRRRKRFRRWRAAPSARSGC